MPPPRSFFLLLAFLILAMLCLASAASLVAHANIQPFHSPWLNLMRGGIYASVLWLSVASALLRSFVGGGGDTTAAQWALLVAAGAAFLAGMGLVQHKKSTALEAVKKLRTDFLQRQSADMGSVLENPGAARRSRPS